MCYGTYYHGTHKDRGKRILKSNKMEYSRGDHEWLGDGIYLYRDKLYAYRWLVIQYREKYGTLQKAADLFEYYRILCVKVAYNYERVFSFMNPEHKLEFQKVKEHLKKQKDRIPGAGKDNITDGVILNLMFNELEYGKDFDMVEAVFPLIVDEKEAGTRLNRLDEYQLCVKNPDNIKQITDHTENFDSEEYYRKLQNFNFYRNKYKTKSRTYTAKRGYKYGKKS